MSAAGTIGATPAEPRGTPSPRSSNHRMMPLVADRPYMLEPPNWIAFTPGLELSGLSRSVSLVAGAPPRWSTLATDISGV